jgi:hypothetical protein
VGTTEWRPAWRDGRILCAACGHSTSVLFSCGKFGFAFADANCAQFTLELRYEKRRDSQLRSLAEARFHVDLRVA